MRLLQKLPIFIAFFTLSIMGLSQETKPDKITVFLDCSDTRCDEDYFRTEITVVDFYRDRIAADVHVLITSNRNASQGRTNQMILYGQNQFSDYQDTVTYVIPPNSTDFERREIVTNYLKMGLIPLVIKTKAAEKLSLDLEMPETDESEESLETEDKWNYWVFRFGGNGSMSFDQNQQSYGLRGFTSGNRTTEESKIGFWFNEEHEFDNYNSEEDTLTVINLERRLEQYFVKSINQHWSAGYVLQLEKDTYSNINARVSLSPAIEYSFYPYDEFNNRLFTLRYYIGSSSMNYIDTTIYDKTKEFLVQQSAELNLRLNQKWGNINSGLRYRNYMHDFALNNIRLYGRFEVRVTGNLFFEMFVFGEIAHDQINLAKGGASKDDVIARVRELQSTFDFGGRFGFNYRFGSKLNNFVNPRFDD